MADNYSSGEEFAVECSGNLPRRTYLVTYSQADLRKFPTRESFGKCVKGHFNRGTGKVKVLHWCCCREEHPRTGGWHYHVALKLSNPKRWKCVKESLMREEGISVHFSDRHHNYLDAYRYVTKEDTDAFCSRSHPDLKDIASPTSKRGTVANRKRSLQRRSVAASQVAKSSNSATVAGGTDNSDSDSDDDRRPAAVSNTSAASKASVATKIRRLSNLDVSEFILAHDIHKDTQLFAEAKKRKAEGQKDLAHFVMSRQPRQIKDLIENTWKMENAVEAVERATRSRMELLEEASNGACIVGCRGIWIRSAQQLLALNGINTFVFAAAVRDLIKKGRGKYRNLLLVGPPTCGKTFLTKPLESIYRCFVNPSNDRYGWVYADKAEIILLQDFRWSAELIAWHDLLLLLEGEIVKLPSPKNQFADDVCIDSDVPIFATSKQRLEYVGKFNSRDDRETEMMNVRWNVFEFSYRFSEEERLDIEPCPTCFARFVLLGQEADM